MKTYYFTFGCGQVHAGCYHAIEAEDSSAARDEMFEKFGDKWSMMYDSAEAAGVERFNLRRISMSKQQIKVILDYIQQEVKSYTIRDEDCILNAYNGITGEVHDCISGIPDEEIKML